MLLSLSVRNYALIDEVEIDFSPHLNIITGETGAGKSILLGALGMILGNRADTKVFFYPDQKCVIEAEFNINHYDLLQWFEEMDIDHQQITIIRREFSQNGKSRAFINDTPVNLQMLQDLASKLIEIHQQFSIYDIQKPSYQLELFDAYAGNKSLQKEYTFKYKQLLELQKSLSALHQTKVESLQETDYIQFQLEELSKVNLDSLDLKTMEHELHLFDNSEAIVRATGTAANMVLNDERSIVDGLENVRSILHPVAGISESIKGFYDRLTSVIIEMRELGKDLEHLSDTPDLDAERADTIRHDLDLVYRLFQKHQVQDLDTLLKIRDGLQNKNSSIHLLDIQIEEVEQKIQSLKAELQLLAHQLSVNRHNFHGQFSSAIEDILHQLGMPHARFLVELTSLEELSPEGLDHAVFKFAANKGFEPDTIKQVASGGEISRLTLAIKSLVAASIPLPTMVFDEIDMGLGGAIALKMSEILNNLSKEHQLITITHSPQIASKADNHLFVYKENDAEKSITRIKALTLEEKIETIAVMLSTDPPTKAALENAKELINQK